MAVGKKTNKAGSGRKWFRLRSFAACVRKDICLFSSAAGIACLLLPFIAACLLAFGLNDALAAENVIELERFGKFHIKRPFNLPLFQSPAAIKR